MEVPTEERVKIMRLEEVINRDVMDFLDGKLEYAPMTYKNEMGGYPIKHPLYHWWCKNSDWALGQFESYGDFVRWAGENGWEKGRYVVSLTRCRGDMRVSDSRSDAYGVTDWSNHARRQPIVDTLTGVEYSSIAQCSKFTDVERWAIERDNERFVRLVK